MDRWPWLPLGGRLGIGTARLLPGRRRNRLGRSIALPPAGLRDGHSGCQVRLPILIVRGVSVQDCLAGGALPGGWFSRVWKKNRSGCPPRSLALRVAREASIPPHHDFGRPAQPADEEVATLGPEAARNQRRSDSPAFPPRGGAGRDRDRAARAVVRTLQPLEY